MRDNGTIVDRRDLLLVGTAGVAVLVSPANAAPAPDEDLKTLMAALEQLGDQLPVSTAPEQDAYIHRLAAQGMLVRQLPIPNMGAAGRSGVEIGPLGRTDPPTDGVHGVALVSYRMAPNALLEPHNHPNYTVATVGITGEALVTHYEPPLEVPPFSSEERFIVRRTVERLLRPRQATTLCPLRDNVHTFRAGPDGARFFDMFSVHGKDVGFSYLAIDATPTTIGGDSFTARWIGPKPSNA